MELAHRRWVGRLVRLGLVVVAIVIVVSWVRARAPRPPDIRIASQPTATEALAPGDMRIYSRDSSVNLVLQGDRILAGLSPEKVAKIRAELKAQKPEDSSGLGGAIATIVKDQVSAHIGTHAVYPLAEIRDIRYENEEIVIIDARGNRARLLGSVKVDEKPLSQSFWPEDAKRFVEAARARKQSLR
jgi:hypothetical protein